MDQDWESKIPGRPIVDQTLILIQFGYKINNMSMLTLQYRVIRMERPYSKQLLWQFLPYDHMGFFGAFYQ